MQARKIKILQLLADGLRLKEIASELGKSEAVIKNLVHRYREQEGADTTIQLVAMSLRRGKIA